MIRFEAHGRVCVSAGRKGTNSQLETEEWRVSDYEVPEPILNSPYDEPGEHWNIEEGASPERRPGRRPAGYFYRDPKAPLGDEKHAARSVVQELALVNLIRERVKQMEEPGLSGSHTNDARPP